MTELARAPSVNQNALTIRRHRPHDVENPANAYSGVLLLITGKIRRFTAFALSGTSPQNHARALRLPRCLRQGLRTRPALYIHQTDL